MAETLFSVKELGRRRANPDALATNHERLVAHSSKDIDEKVSQYYAINVAAGQQAVTGYTFNGKRYDFDKAADTPEKLLEQLEISYGRVCVYPKVVANYYAGSVAHTVQCWFIGEVGIEHFHRMDNTTINPQATNRTGLLNLKQWTFMLTNGNNYTFDVDATSQAIATALVIDPADVPASHENWQTVIGEIIALGNWDTSLATLITIEFGETTGEAILTIHVANTDAVIDFPQV